jgi:hypothetical protein
MPAYDITHYTSRTCIQDDRQENELRPESNVGDVSHPELVRTDGNKVPSQFGEDQFGLIAVGGDGKLTNAAMMANSGSRSENITIARPFTYRC